VEEILNKKIKEICEDVDADEPPILYVTNSEWLNKELNRRRKFRGEPEEEYKPLFRYEVAKTQPYKGNRKNPKPFHFYNLLIYMLGEYNVVVSNQGLEADDMMCIEQNKREDTIICSRDKDLRICPGWHYSWECGKQKSVGPFYTDKLGSLELKTTEKTHPVTGKVTLDKKVIGYGLKFFYYQMLVGDTADHIPGLKGWGLVGSYDLLSDCKSEKELFTAVKKAYVDSLGKQEAKEMFLEQANLLWMHQAENDFYKIPKFSVTNSPK
jgi:hypothetical protein